MEQGVASREYTTSWYSHLTSRSDTDLAERSWCFTFVRFPQACVPQVDGRCGLHAWGSEAAYFSNLDRVFSRGVVVIRIEMRWHGVQWIARSSGSVEPIMLEVNWNVKSLGH